MEISFWNNSTTITKSKLFLVFLIGISLPFKDIFSTIAILILTAVSLYSLFNDNKDEGLRFPWVLFLIPVLLIIPRLIGLFTGQLNGALDELLRAIPILLVPFIFLTFKSYSNVEKSFYYGLLLGLMLFLIICEFVVIRNMISSQEPLEYFFRWRHLNINFVKPIDNHPPYVAILVIWLFVKTITKNYLSNRLKYILLAISALFLFQLLARNAIILAVILALYFSVRSLNLKYILFASGIIAILFTVVIYHPHDYLRNKILNSFNLNDYQNRDKRVNRLKASVEVFKLEPVFGVGPKNDNELRKKEFKKMGDYTAYKYNYNSHNQFFEYLVSHGVLGLLCFISLLFIIARISFKNKDYDNFILLLCFIMACLTESVLERSLGTKYFSILIAFILLKHSELKRKVTLN